MNELAPKRDDERVPALKPLPDVPPDGAERRVWSRLVAHRGRLLKSLVGAAVLVAAAWSLLRTYVFSVSSQAVVGGLVTTIRSPIDGVLQAPGCELGALVPAGAALGSVVNRWEPDTTVRDLENRMEAADVQVRTLRPIAQAMGSFAGGLRSGARAYQQGRVGQLQALAAAAQAEVDGAQANLTAVGTSSERTAKLFAEGAASGEQTTAAERDVALARERLERARHNHEAVRIELAAAERGVHIDANGGATDQPYSKQRFDEVTLERIRFDQRIQEAQELHATLRAELDRARARYEEVSHASLVSPHRARVWRVFATPGSFVSRAQPILSLADCDMSVVIATVTGRVFNRLQPDERATFRFYGGGERYHGKVLLLAGRVVPGNEDALVAPGLEASFKPNEKDYYQVVLSFPDLARQANGECAIGRSGEVWFH